MADNRTICKLPYTIELEAKLFFYRVKKQDCQTFIFVFVCISEIALSNLSIGSMPQK